MANAEEIGPTFIYYVVVGVGMVVVLMAIIVGYAIGSVRRLSKDRGEKRMSKRSEVVANQEESFGNQWHNINLSNDEEEVKETYGHVHKDDEGENQEEKEILTPPLSPVVKVHRNPSVGVQDYVTDSEYEEDVKFEAKEDLKLESKEDVKLEAKGDVKLEAKEDVKLEAKEDVKFKTVTIVPNCNEAGETTEAESSPSPRESPRESPQPISKPLWLLKRNLPELAPPSDVDSLDLRNAESPIRNNEDEELGGVTDLEQAKEGEWCKVSVQGSPTLGERDTSYSSGGSSLAKLASSN